MLKQLPLVSIILGTYNRADWLKIAIESVLAQTYQNFELLILDNCSSDHTPEIVAGFDDFRIKYIRHQCNIGSSENWGYGIYWAKGEYLTFLGDDDFYRQDFLYSRVSVFLKYKDIQAVFSHYECCDEHGNITEVSKALFGCEKKINGAELLICVLKHSWFIGDTLFRRDVVLKHWEDNMRAGKACDTSLKVRIALELRNSVIWIENKGLVQRNHSHQGSRVGGKQVLFGHIAAFNEPLLFGNYTWSHRRLLKQGAAWAYDILGRSSWDAGEIKVARRCFFRQLVAFPLNIKLWLRLLRCYLPWLYPKLCIRRSMTI